MAYTFVGNAITETTRKELGIAVSPHLFRDCAVYTVATHTGHQMEMAAALLPHTDPSVTEKHYNKGAMIEAAKDLQALVDSIGG